MNKIILSICTCILLCSCMQKQKSDADGFSFGAGIFYPRLVYGFRQIGGDPDYGPAEECLRHVNENSQQISFIFRRPGNTLKKRFQPFFLVKKPYKELYIKKLSYEYEGKSGVFLEDAYFDLPEFIRTPDVPIKRGYVTLDNSYYWLNGWDALPKDTSKGWPEVNFEKVFSKKKLGDSFPFKLIITCQFDKEQIATLEILYQVTVFKGKYVSPFAGI